MRPAQDYAEPPESREELLKLIGGQRRLIYEMVRHILDDLEKAAPWGKLYYPPTEIEEFVRMEDALLDIVGGIPQRVDELRVRMLARAVRRLVRTLPERSLSSSGKEVLADLLEDTRADSLNQSMKEMAQKAVDAIPAEDLGDHLRALLLGFLNRDEVEPLSDLSDDLVEAAVHEFPNEAFDESAKQIFDNLGFYFMGIHAMVGPDMAKLDGRLAPYREGSATELTPQERAYTCEISADLKGKYSSSVMGAASNLIADEHWNGAEIEPLLFPEKAEEFDRNEELVETLREVMDSIKRVPVEVPLKEIVETWGERERIDRYALTHLYGFLGNIGKLMRESSRRALYSGDYHQVQTRESALATRINELNTLHNMTWGVAPPGWDGDLAECFPKMIRVALELAALLDTELLKSLIGAESHRTLLRIVELEAERRKEVGDAESELVDPEKYITEKSTELRERIPARLHVLVPLLYEEDLQTFLELLLGSVVKRGSFTVKARIEERKKGSTAGPSEEEETGPERPAAKTLLDVDFNSIEIIEAETGEPGTRMGTPPSGPRFEPPPPLDTPAVAEEPAYSPTERLEYVQKLHGFLLEILSPSNPNRKGFDLIQRFLKQGKMVPPAMLQSMQPYVDDIRDMLLPQVAIVVSNGDVPRSLQSNLDRICQQLSQPPRSPLEIKSEIGPDMERLIHVLEGLKSLSTELVDKYSAEASGTEGEFLTSVDF